MDTTIENWTEWKKKCDLRRCGDETKATLLAYMQKRMHALVKWAMVSLSKVAHSQRLPASARSRHQNREYAYHDIKEIDQWTGWDLFENYYVARGERTHKVYKDWLFLPAQDSSEDHVSVLEKKAHTLLRNVIRDYIKENYPPKQARSMDAPLQLNKDDEAAWSDFEKRSTQSPRDKIETWDARDAATGFAAQFFDNMDLRERVVLAVLGLDLPASCPEAERAAQCKKSMLGHARGQLCTRLKTQLEREFSEDTVYLGFYVVEALTAKCITWAKNETDCAPIFSLAAQRQAEGGRP